MINKFALYFLVFVYTVEADIISCRSLSITNWNEVGEQKTCDLSISTTIVVDNMSFEGEADTTIGALDLRTNGPITFLPIDIDKKFPALVLYESCCGSIKTIAKKNFKSLISLRWLNLGDNQIDRIPSDTFEDMKALEWIELHRNKIKFLNGFAFSGLINLKSVGLNDNECINEYFSGQDIATISEIVTEKCGYNENRANSGPTIIVS